MSAVGTAASGSQIAAPPRAALGTGPAQMNWRVDAASTTGTVDGVPALPRKTTKSRVQPGGGLGERLVLVILASVAPAIRAGVIMGGGGGSSRPAASDEAPREHRGGLIELWR